MQMKGPDMIMYMIAIVMFALSVTIHEMFAIEMCVALPWPLQVGQAHWYVW